MFKKIKESQNTEFKLNWRDENLKTICAFANTEGGTLKIGIDDNGNVIGIVNIKKLPQEILEGNGKNVRYILKVMNR